MLYVTDLFFSPPIPLFIPPLGTADSHALGLGILLFKRS